MKFFNQNLCKKLSELGCISETNFAWIFDDYNEWEAVPTEPYDMTSSLKYTDGPYDAFSIYDFLSDEEYAEENCKKIIALEVCVDCGKSRDKTCLPPTRKAHVGLCSGWQYLKLTLAHSKNQEAYIEEAVESVIKRI